MPWCDRVEFQHKALYRCFNKSIRHSCFECIITTFVGFGFLMIGGNKTWKRLRLQQRSNPRPLWKYSTLEIKATGGQLRVLICSLFLIQGSVDLISADNQSPKRTPERYIVEVDDCLPECCVFPVSSKQHFTWLKFRCSIRCLVEHKYFEWFILFTVMFSSFVLVRLRLT